MNYPLWLAALLAASLTACSCDDTPGGGLDSGEPEGDGAIGDGSSGSDGSLPGDGAVGDGAALDGGTGDAGRNDGSPLEEPLSDFCQGMGTTVVVIGSGGECAGDLAESTFQFGLCACDTVRAQSMLSTDAFNSGLGAYGVGTPGGGVNVSDDGNLGVNGQLQIDGKLTTRGSAYIGGGGFSVGASSEVTGLTYAVGSAVQSNASTTLGYNAYFDGNVEGRFNIAGDLHVPVTATVSTATRNNLGGRLVRSAIPAIRPCACESSEILDIGALTAWAATHNDNRVQRVLTSTTFDSGGPGQITLPCGRYYLNRIAQPGGLTIRAEGRTVLFVDGPMNIGGGFNLELAPGAEVDLFVKDSLSIGASARFGDPARPASVRTYVGGSGQIALSASAIFGGLLYAPRADVVFSASADLYGALYCNSADFSGSASVHFDTAVRSAGQACEEPTDGGVADAGGPDASATGDAGASESDAGPTDGSIPDAGSPDTGPVGCNGCGQCGNLACVIEPGATTGTCQGCLDDLDCCAPQVCQAGVCTYNL